MAPSDLRLASLSGDWIGDNFFLGYVNPGSTSNGFARPFFTSEEVQRIHSFGAIEAVSFVPGEPLTLDMGAGGQEGHATVRPVTATLDGVEQTLYDLGHLGWCWQADSACYAICPRMDGATPECFAQLRAQLLVAMVADMKAEILEAVAVGQVPADAADFSELHDYCDANAFGGFCDDYVHKALQVAFPPDDPTDPVMSEAHSDFSNEAQGLVDAWIKAGGLNESATLSRPAVR